VDRAAKVIRIEDTKNGEARTCPYGEAPELVALIEEQWDWTHRLRLATGCVIDHVFHRNGKPISDFRGAWRKTCEAAGVPDRVSHDLRRTRVRNFERDGVARSRAMKITGHKTESVYRRYAIVNEADLAEAMAQAARGKAARREGKIIRLPA
jgi:integrase